MAPCRVMIVIQDGLNGVHETVVLGLGDIELEGIENLQIGIVWKALCGVCNCILDDVITIIKTWLKIELYSFRKPNESGFPKVLEIKVRNHFPCIAGIAYSDHGE